VYSIVSIRKTNFGYMYLLL